MENVGVGRAVIDSECAFDELQTNRAQHSDCPAVQLGP